MLRNRPLEFPPYIIRNNFLSNQRCDIICKTLSSKIEPAVTKDPFTGEFAVRSDYAVSNTAFWRLDQNNSWIFRHFNKELSESNKKYWNFDLNGYEVIQYSEYNKGGMIDWHTDHVNDYNENHGSLGDRKLSVSLILNDDYAGGEFCIAAPQPKTDYTTLQLNKGDAIIFPSFMFHKVKPVTSGTRKTLVIFVEGPKLK